MLLYHTRSDHLSEIACEILSWFDLTYKAHTCGRCSRAPLSGPVTSTQFPIIQIVWQKMLQWHRWIIWIEKVSSDTQYVQTRVFSHHQPGIVELRMMRRVDHHAINCHRVYLHGSPSELEVTTWSEGTLMMLLMTIASSLINLHSSVRSPGYIGLG